MRSRALLVALGVVAVGAVLFFALRPDSAPTEAPVIAMPESDTAVMPGIPADAFEMTVESVHDGDTLRARVVTPNAVVTDLASTRVRLVGIDTPEISPALDCWGGEATQRLAGMLPPGAWFWASADQEVLDQYGRHLLYLWTAEGLFVNAELIAAGDAEVMVFAPNDLHEDLFRSLESEASTHALGLWGACP